MALLILGNLSADLELSFELGRLDAPWLLIGLPVMAILVLLLVSPLSFRVHGWLWRESSRTGTRADEPVDGP